MAEQASEAGASVLYNRARIQRGHHLVRAPLDDGDRAALDALDGVLESEATPRIETLIPAGTALLFSNRKLLHNRTAQRLRRRGIAVEAVTAVSVMPPTSSPSST